MRVHTGQTTADISEDLAIPTDLVAFELVVFERKGDMATVTVQGMSSASDVEMVAFEQRGRRTLSVMGRPSLGEVRSFAVVSDLEVEADHDVVVRGLLDVEVVCLSDLPEHLPLVCGADPSQAGIEGEFLHRRGNRYVLMSTGADDGRVWETLVA